MRDLIRVLVLGTGQMGAGIARLLLNKQGLHLSGAFARRAARGGLDLGTAIGLNRDLRLAVSNDLHAVYTVEYLTSSIITVCLRGSGQHAYEL